MRAKWTLTPNLAIALAVASLGAAGCGSSGPGPAPASPPCDQACQDAVAVRSLRESMKLAFNVALQGKPVGAQDQTEPCPLGGSVHVFGQATSNAVQGATFVQLTYDFSGCAYSQTDSDPKQSYATTLTGTVTENGTLAVQPSSTTSLAIASDGMTFAGTVYDPPIPYDVSACPVTLGQNGNQLGGTICGRSVGLNL